MIIILFGPPGCGKGTHAEILSKRWNLLPVATGEIFRQERAKGTDLGKKIEGFLDSGQLVPDDIVLEVIRRYLRQNKNRGFIFDGFPRTLTQGLGLDKILRDLNKTISYVFLLEISEAEIIRRLTTRRVCRKCEKVYNTEFSPPAKEGICDVCGGEVYQREDDKEETIRKRIEVYETQTKDLIYFYEKKGLLYRINGELGKEEVQRLLNEIIARSAPAQGNAQ